MTGSAGVLMTGLGLDLESCWAGLLEGRNAVRRFTLFDPEGLPTPFGVDLPAEVRLTRLDTGASVLLDYHPETVPPAPEMPPLMARVAPT